MSAHHFLKNMMSLILKKNKFFFSRFNMNETETTETIPNETQHIDTLSNATLQRL